MEDPRALGRLAAEALGILHYDPETGEDLRHAPRAREDCEAACYDCLMSYANQSDHLLLDRHAIKEVVPVTTAEVAEARSDLRLHSQEEEVVVAVECLYLNFYT